MTRAAWNLLLRGDRRYRSGPGAGLLAINAAVFTSSGPLDVKRALCPLAAVGGTRRSSLQKGRCSTRVHPNSDLRRIRPRSVAGDPKKNQPAGYVLIPQGVTISSIRRRN